MSKQEDTIRVLRIYEFTGPRSLVEAQVAKSIHGDKDVGNGLVIKGATIGTYPEILEAAVPEPIEPPVLLKAHTLRSSKKPGLIRVISKGNYAYLARRGQQPGIYHIVPEVHQAAIFTSEKESWETWHSLCGSGDFNGWSYMDYQEPPEPELVGEGEPLKHFEPLTWVVKVASMTGATYVRTSKVTASGYTQGGLEAAVRFTDREAAEKVLAIIKAAAPSYMTVTLEEVPSS